MRTSIGITILTGAMLAGSIATSAEERTEDQCAALHPQATSPVEMATCTSDLDGSKKLLNRAYGGLAKLLQGDRLSALEKAQHLWVEYRTAECQLETGGMPGSTGYDSGVISCTANMNRRRAGELQKMAESFK
ncbi:lysozyme inhibitor LprI family protein [Bradyrhizobium sp. STM 3809]|uniref:lysozyme inhibitor LprI family protein n=1 Tax=Bradyrhizobium sp. STM 3809 TaxID=551936 RepID=UPI0002405FDB|nr:lysozyme inhibitor LprI family protein [Bradyrhizobium sp. STM 3809]CCD98145.1 exported hypothetical protein [Bradyrhizobium sp. STM 3809]